MGLGRPVPLLLPLQQVVGCDGSAPLRLVVASAASATLPLRCGRAWLLAQPPNQKERARCLSFWAPT